MFSDEVLKCTESIASHLLLLVSGCQAPRLLRISNAFLQTIKLLGGVRVLLCFY
jgi:hypothetical protein